MLLDTQIIGDKIIEELQQLIDEDIIVTDPNGFIIASTDNHRLNQFHEGALHAMKTLTPLQITKSKVHEYQGASEGILFPIIVEQTSLGVIGITGKIEEIKNYIKLVQRMTELYVEDFIERRKKEWSTYSFEFFLMDFLNERIEPSRMKKRIEPLNIDPNLYTRIIVVDLHKPIEISTIQHIQNIQPIHPDLKISRWGIEKLILLVPNLKRNYLEESLKLFHNKVEKLMKSSVYIGVGNQQQFSKLPTSYKQANVAISVCFNEQCIVFEEDLTIDILISNATKEQRKTFIDRTLAPILNDEELVNNLDHWLKSEESLQDVADQLHIHKNTLKYRLKKVEKLLNIDLHNSRDKSILYIALYLYKISLREE